MELLDKIKLESGLNIRMLELEMMKEIWFDMKSIELNIYDDDIDINYKYRGINGVGLTKLLNNLYTELNMISSFSELIRNNIYLKLLEIKNEVRETIIRRKKMYDFDDIQEKCFESINVKNAENVIIDKEIEKIRQEIIAIKY